MEDWKALPRGSFFRSARLDCALSLLSGAMVREEKRGKLLALPYSENAPFPLAELFCLPASGRSAGESASSTAWMRKIRPSCEKMQIMSTIPKESMLYSL